MSLVQSGVETVTQHMGDVVIVFFNRGVRLLWGAKGHQLRGTGATRPPFNLH